MNQALMDCLVNPSKSRILVTISIKGQATAKQLMAELSDIAPATMYRHLGRMLSVGLLEVAEENRVRGAVEKVYRVKRDFVRESEEMLRERPGEAALALFTQFQLSLLREFSAYFARPDVDMARDKVSFTVAPICASDEEMMELFQQMGELIKRYTAQKVEGGRTLRSMALIVAPPKPSEEDEDA